MPDIGEMRDTYVIETKLEDNATDAAKRVADAVGSIEDSAIKAATALKSASSATGDVAAPVTVASTAFSKLAASVERL